MKYTTLSHTQIRVSSVAYGCMSTVGSQTYAGVDDEAAVSLMHAAMDAGITFFDTAAGYADGHSERQLGAAIKGRRDRVVIATKASGPTLSAGEIVADCEASLRRLGVDTIDLYQIHWPRRKVPLDETLSAMEQLQRSGKVRAIGVCNFGPGDLGEAIGSAVVSTNQLAYSLLTRALEIEVGPMCVEHGVGVLCYSPLAQGLLSGRYRCADDVPSGRARTRHFAGHRPEASHGGPGCEAETFAAIARIADVAQRLGQPMPQVALAWLLHQPIVTAVLVGGTRADQVQQNAATASIVLSRDDLDELDGATREVKERLGSSLDLWAAQARTR